MTGELRCPLCSFCAPPTVVPLPCPECTIPIGYRRDLPLDLLPSDLTGEGVWRYAPLLPDVEPVALGEGDTPLVSSVRIGPQLGVDLWFKVEGANPSGSFKDRGASVMVSVLQSFGAKAVTDDSSGNAGAALAAYAARAGLRAVLYVPAHASGPKLSQISALGADVVRVPGPRERAADAVREACRTDSILLYASHNASPYFVSGITTLAYELFEGLGERPPDHVVVPVGGGGLFLGVVYGFLRLRGLGWIEHIPQVHIVQPAACAPIVCARAAGGVAPFEREPSSTIAEGARIPNPPRGREIVAMLKAVGGEAVAVGEEEILNAQRLLSHAEGLYVEPTSALPAAALAQLVARGTICEMSTVAMVLTGTGLKTVPS